MAPVDKVLQQHFEEQKERKDYLDEQISIAQTQARPVKKSFAAGLAQEKKICTIFVKMLEPLEKQQNKRAHPLRKRPTFCRIIYIMYTEKSIFQIR